MSRESEQVSSQFLQLPLSGSGGVCPGTAPDGTSWGGIAYEYQYSSTGRTTGKRMAVTRRGSDLLRVARTNAI